MSSGDNPGRSENLQGKGSQQALQAVIRGSADTYAEMFNASLFPFLLYQQSLALATQAVLDGLRAATRVAQQGTLGSSQPTRWGAETAEGAARSGMQTAQQSTTMDVATDQVVQQKSEVSDATAREDMEAINQAAQDKMRTAGRATLQQGVQATEATVRESYAETADRTPIEIDEIASGLSEPTPTSFVVEAPNTAAELPSSPASEAMTNPAAEAAVDETDEGGMKTSSRAVGAAADEFTSLSAPVPSLAEEEPGIAEEPPPLQEEEFAASEGTNTIEELSSPPEVPDVELSPPPPVPQNILDELPPPPTVEVPEEPAAQDVQREVPRLHVKRITAAARRKAEEMNVDLAEVEGTGRDGQITIGDVRKKAEEKQS